MPHTQGRYQQDLGFTDGRVFAPPNDIHFSGTTVLTRNAAGDWSLNQAASQTVLYAVNVAELIERRTGFGEDLQEQFGGTGIPASAQQQVYRPDVSAGMSTGQEITPRTALKVKGYKLLSVDVIYQIGTLALTTHTIRIDQTVHANNVANAITAVLANGANGLATAVQANPYVTNVPLAAGQQIYRIGADQSIWVELNVVTPATSTYKLYGFDCSVEFNFN